MQKAVEKRKATLAAKKAAQVAAEQRNGLPAPPRPDAGPSQTIPAPPIPVETTPFTHGYQSAVPQPAEQTPVSPNPYAEYLQHMSQHAYPEHQQQTQPRPADFGAGYPTQH